MFFWCISFTILRSWTRAAKSQHNRTADILKVTWCRDRSIEFLVARNCIGGVCYLFSSGCAHTYTRRESVYACYVPSKYDIFRMGGTQLAAFSIDGVHCVCDRVRECSLFTVRAIELHRVRWQCGINGKRVDSFLFVNKIWILFNDQQNLRLEYIFQRKEKL